MVWNSTFYLPVFLKSVIFTIDVVSKIQIYRTDMHVFSLNLQNCDKT